MGLGSSTRVSGVVGWTLMVLDGEEPVVLLEKVSPGSGTPLRSDGVSTDLHLGCPWPLRSPSRPGGHGPDREDGQTSAAISSNYLKM